MDEFDEQARELVEHCRYCGMPDYRPKCETDWKLSIQEVAQALRSTAAERDAEIKRLKQMIDDDQVMLMDYATENQELNRLAKICGSGWALVEYAKLEAKCAEWKAAIEGLTPSGSEFVDDPQRCATYIRERSNHPKQIISAYAEIERLEGQVAYWKEVYRKDTAMYANEAERLQAQLNANCLQRDALQIKLARLREALAKIADESTSKFTKEDTAKQALKESE